MAGNLVIVESPAKANTIKKYLGKNYKVVASMGHIVDLPKSNIGVDIENGFVPKYITIRGKGELMAKLKKDAKNADKVYLATDPDREGEAISWHLANVLGLDKSKKIRITFNEITKNAVKESIKQPKEINEDFVNAQQARRILDRIVGYKISPLLWKNVKKGLSAGRVQSVATKIICDREKEISEFKPKEYWTVTANLKKGKNEFAAKFYGKDGKKIELPNEEETNKVLEAVGKSDFVVSEVKKSEKIRRPAPPFTTSTMQQEASRKLNYSTKKTMSVAQILYEGVEVKDYGTLGLITYMRTDSLRISDEAGSLCRDYLKEHYSEEYIPKEIPKYKSRNNAQDAHEAIRPTVISITPKEAKASLKPDQYKLYKLIWERFVASQMTNAVYETVNSDIDAGGYTFKTSGSKLVFPGFTKIYEESTDEAKAETQVLPLLEKGEQLSAVSIEKNQNFTLPPSRYTEASLIKTMEENGIGRPSTYSPTISTILARGYIVKEQKSLKPTELGEIVTKIMSEHFKDIVNVDFTANMEKQLDEIEDGKSWKETLNSFYGSFKKDLEKAEDNMEKVVIEDEVTDIPCEKCGRMMVIKQGKFGKFLACPGFPECRNTKTIAVETGINCPKCGGMILEKKSQRGKKYYGCENNPTCDFMMWDAPTKEKCPECGSMLGLNYFRGKTKLKCSNPECKYEREAK